MSFAELLHSFMSRCLPPYTLTLLPLTPSLPFPLLSHLFQSSCPHPSFPHVRVTNTLFMPFLCCIPSLLTFSYLQPFFSFYILVLKSPSPRLLSSQLFSSYIPGSHCHISGQRVMPAGEVRHTTTSHLYSTLTLLRKASNLPTYQHTLVTYPPFLPHHQQCSLDI